LKGAFREEAVERAGNADGRKKLVDDLFGPPPPTTGDGESSESNDEKKYKHPQPSEFAGAVGIGDARLLLLPVRSARAGWAWLTSALCLERLARDLEIVGPSEPRSWVTLKVDEGAVLVPTASKLVAGSDESAGKSLILEDLQYEVKASE
jgi:CRISPR/Cas system CMR subunit Cmr4 (Cas7 group RAMP superfamily)